MNNMITSHRRLDLNSQFVGQKFIKTHRNPVESNVFYQKPHLSTVLK